MVVGLHRLVLTPVLRDAHKGDDLQPLPPGGGVVETTYTGESVANSKKYQTSTDGLRALFSICDRLPSRP